MNKLKLFWEFHKSTLVLSWSFSIALSVITLNYIILLITSMTAGPIISLFYKELTSKNEYYFYNNNGISKIKLILVSYSFHILLGLLLLLICLL